MMVSPLDLKEPAAELGMLPARGPLLQLTPLRGVLTAFADDGRLTVRFDASSSLTCDWLEQSEIPPLTLGDVVLVVLTGNDASGVVVGRIGRYSSPAAKKKPERVLLEATEMATIKCGEASLDLHANGDLMIRGENVLIRAKGTQRIRAGTVSIN